jgi:DNA end-binding protein Ku
MRRSIWKGSISFGLLNIPVALFPAEKSEDKLKFSLLDKKNLAPIKYKKVNADTGKEVPYPQIVKGYEYEPGEYVILNKKDFDAANVKATQTIDIENFVLLEDIDPMLFERPYYLTPEKAGTKGYILLRDALAKLNRLAVGKIVIRTKQHLCAIMPREDYLVLEILRFAHEVVTIDKADYLKELNTKKSYSSRELTMAEELIESMTTPWKPLQYKDTYFADLKKQIEKKIKKGESHTVETPEETREPRTTRNVVDLLPLLQKSLESKKSPKRRKAR